MAKPAKPNVTGDDRLTQTSARIAFQAGESGGNNTINSWVVQAEPRKPHTGGTYAKYKELRDKPKATSLVIDELSPYVRYWVRVYASNADGASPPSDYYDLGRTLPNAPGPTTGTYLDAQGSTGLHYIFTAPADKAASAFDGAIPPYTFDVGYGVSPNNPDTIVNNLKVADYFITGLNGYTTYYVWSRAVNAGGAGPWSNRLEMRTRSTGSDAPQPKGITYLDMISAKYEWAQGDTHGPGVLEWQFGYSEDPNTIGGVTTVGGPGVHLFGLRPATKYYIWSRQRTEDGWSAWSARTDFRTVAGARVFFDGQWREAIPFVKIDGSWKWVQPFQKRVGLWKRAV